MTDHFENKPISTFDEICHLTIETMCKMDMENLLQLKKQATRELDRAKMTKGRILTSRFRSNRQRWIVLQRKLMPASKAYLMIEVMHVDGMVQGVSRYATRS